jgi:PhnB protein
MAIRSLNPYLIFEGNAQQAMDFYEKALGARVEALMRYGDVKGNPHPPKEQNRVMQAKLAIGSGVMMVGDSPPGNPAPQGMHVALDFDDPVDMARKFEALALGGHVEMPLHDAFWGARFGMLTDSFGVGWMFNCATQPK